ncbi:hypothetical protein ACJX0J_024118, partial [Zea mays]
SYDFSKLLGMDDGFYFIGAKGPLLGIPYSDLGRLCGDQRIDCECSVHSFPLYRLQIQRLFFCIDCEHNMQKHNNTRDNYLEGYYSTCFEKEIPGRRFVMYEKNSYTVTFGNCTCDKRKSEMIYGEKLAYEWGLQSDQRKFKYALETNIGKYQIFGLKIFFTHSHFNWWLRFMAPLYWFYHFLQHWEFSRH